MDNDSNNKDRDQLNPSNNNELHVDINDETHSDESDSLDVDEINSDIESTVEDKKPSGNLSLWLAVLALLAMAYLYYLHWQNGNDTNDSVPTETIQQLQDSDQVLSTDIQNAEVDVNQIKKQLKQLTEQVSTLSNNISSQTDSKAFDNSTNETSMAELQQQLNQQAKLISDLQTISSAVTPPNVAQEVFSDSYDQIEKNAAIQVLLTTDVLLTTNRLPQALMALENYLKVSGLQPLHKNKILGLLNELKQVSQPDLAQIEQQLQALKSTVDSLKITAEKQADEELKWYERFVSVKKINTDQSISSTTELVGLQAELNRLIYQAKLYLMLNDPTGWQNTLITASDWVEQNMPEHQKLSNGFINLSKQTVVANVPEDLNISKVIDELKGLR